MECELEERQLVCKRNYSELVQNCVLSSATRVYEVFSLTTCRYLTSQRADISLHNVLIFHLTTC